MEEPWLVHRSPFPHDARWIRAVVSLEPALPSSSSVAGVYLANGRHEIGRVTRRSDVSDLAIGLDDDRVSSRHATLLVGEQTVLEDKASTNGTRVNGFRIKRCVVKDGSVISFGRSAQVDDGKRILWLHQGTAAERLAQKASAVPRNHPVTSVINSSKWSAASWDLWEEYVQYSSGGAGIMALAFLQADKSKYSTELALDFAITDAAATLDPAIHIHTRQRDGMFEFKLLCPSEVGNSVSVLRRSAKELSRRLASIGLKDVAESKAPPSTRSSAAPVAPEPGNARPRPSAPPAPAPAPSRRVLLHAVHISDLHVGAGNQGWRYDQERVAAALVEDLRRSSWVGPRPFIYVTGDIAFSADERQYREATKHIGELVAACHTAESSVRMVPGNHDCDRSQSAAILVRLLHDGIRRQPDALDDVMAQPEAYEHLERKLRNYQRFIASVSRHPRDLDWREDLGDGVALLGLSTVFTSDKDDDEGSVSAGGNLVVGRSQLARLVPPGNRDRLRILLSHHPLEWLARPSQELVTEALAGVPCVHLCGHVHAVGGGVRRRVGASTTRLVLNAGAAHHGPKEPGPHTYCRIQLAIEPDGTFAIGWSPRLYVPTLGAFHLDASRHPELDSQTGFAWERLQVPSVPT